MKNRNIAHYLLALASLVAFGASSCSDWTEEQPVKQDIIKPGDQDPEKYAQYLETLRSYKKSNHYLVFARMNNAPEISVSERDFLRSMPDSLDVVSLRYGDKITDYDAEDIPLVQKKGTRILYGFDPSEQNGAGFTQYLNGLIERIRTLGLNGISVVLSTPLSAQDEQTLVNSLSVVAGPGKSLLLVFEGNPEAISKTNRSKSLPTRCRMYLKCATASFMRTRSAALLWTKSSFRLFLTAISSTATTSCRKPFRKWPVV